MPKPRLNNAAERALRGTAIGRKASLFAGSDRGGESAASMFMLIEAAKLNGIDPQAWLADALRRIADHPVFRLNQLLAGIRKTAPIKLLLLDRLSRRGTQRMPTPVQRLSRLHRLLIQAALKGCPRRTAAASN